MGSNITLNSQSGNQMINLEGDVLKWSESDINLVNAVAGQISTPSTAVDIAKVTDCVSLIRGSLGGQADYLLNEMIEDMYDQTPSPTVQGCIIGNLMTPEYGTLVRDLMSRGSDLVRQQLGSQASQIVNGILAQSNPTIRSALMIEWARSLKSGRSLSFNELLTQVLRQIKDLDTPKKIKVETEESIEERVDGDNKDIADLGDAIANRNLNAFNNTLLQTMRDGVDLGAVRDLLARDGMPARRMLQAAMNNPQLRVVASQILRDLPRIDTSQTDSGSSTNLGPSIDTSDVAALESLLLSSQPTTAIAETYHSSAFQSHVMGFILR